MQALTKEVVLQALESCKATSISQIYKALGGKGNVSGSTAKHIRELVPGINDVLEANRKTQAGVGGKTSDTGGAKKVHAKREPKKVAKTSSKFPRHPKNPFREGSSYATCFNILASKKSGMRKDEAVKLLAQEVSKPEKNASYDLGVLSSARDSNHGQRHKSCKEGFWIKRENDHLTLMID